MNNEKYQNKYRIESIRLKSWDYSCNGFYYVTICVKNREHIFGEIIDNEMILSEIGKIAHQNWINMIEHFKNIEIDEFIIMPNHIHGIILINNEQLPCRDVIYNVSTNTNNNDNPPTNESSKNKYFSNISPIKNTLSVIIRTYKASVSRICKKNNMFFEWQARFYDHIIRNEKSLENVRSYIKNNPINWVNDKNNNENNG